MSRLFANLGAEADADWRRMADSPAVAAAAAHWREIIEPPAFDWLPGNDTCIAWLNTDEAAEAARAAGLELAFSPPDVVRRVHDKAFALEVARAGGWLDPELADCMVAFDPEDLLPEDDAVRAIQARLDGWPEPLRNAFTLKPRLGSSGRGRVAGQVGRADTAALRGALPRLASSGGAILEPWLERICDLSAQLLVRDDGSLLVLGSTDLELAASGLYRGQSGTVDSRGRVAARSRHDERVREAAVAVAAEAAAAGFRGPCGVDAFAYRDADGREMLRPIVELNARFTLGIVAIGLVRRALPGLRESTGLSPGQLRGFRLTLETAPGDPALRFT